MVVCLNIYVLIGDFGPAVTLAHFCLFKESFFTKIWQWHFEGFSKISSKIWHFRLRSRELCWTTCPSQLKPAEFIQYGFLGNCVWLAKSVTLMVLYKLYKTSQNVNNKSCSSSFIFSMKKKFRKIWLIFDLENSLWKSNFHTLLRAGKARQSIPGHL